LGIALLVAGYTWFEASALAPVTADLSDEIESAILADSESYLMANEL
jgi:hypothetical protein